MSIHTFQTHTDIARLTSSELCGPILPLHFILPLIIIIIVFLHLTILHISASTSPIHSKNDIYKIIFYPYFIIEDIITIIFISLIFMYINLQNPYIFGEIRIILKLLNVKVPYNYNN